jgi:hypothetical protein
VWSGNRGGGAKLLHSRDMVQRNPQLNDPRTIIITKVRPLPALVHHCTTGKLVNNGIVTIQEDHRWPGSASTALPQTVRTLESQRRRGSRMEGRNDGGCEQRTVKDLAKFSRNVEPTRDQHNAFPQESLSHVLCIGVLNCPFTLIKISRSRFIFPPPWNIIKDSLKLPTSIVEQPVAPFPIPTTARTRSGWLSMQLGST